MVKTRWRPNPGFRPALSELIRKGPIEARLGAREALRQNGEEIIPVIKRAAPVDDGDLQQSINWTFGDPPPGTLGVNERRRDPPGIPDDLRISLYAGGKKAPHAHLVHYGTGPRFQKDGAATGVMPARPFFFPDVRAFRNRFRNRIRRLTAKGLKAGLSK